jgi:AcrR family transcriptional regulator
MCNMTTPDHRPVVAAQRRERMRSRLMQAAFALASEGGISSVTIDAVVARAEVARGTFYKYFESSQSLLEAVGSEVSDVLIETMNPFVSRLEDPAERIAVGVGQVLQIGQLYPPLAGFLVRAGWPARDLSPRFHTVVDVTLREGMAQARFADMPVGLAQGVVLGALLGALFGVTAQTPVALVSTIAAVLRGLGVSADEAARLAAHPLPITAAVMSPALARLSGA